MTKGWRSCTVRRRSGRRRPAGERNSSGAALPLQRIAARHFKETSTLYLEIVDYPGEWLLDLPMLAQDYLSWSRQMTGLLQGQREAWSARWRQLCDGLDPLAPADENRLAEIAAAWTEYLHACKREGLHFIQPGRFVLPGDMAGAPALQFSLAGRGRRRRSEAGAGG
jgi:predicted YcjX-like family ATPase